jgi:hypothetical protein
MSHVIEPNSARRVTFCNIVSSLTLHSSPPELCLQIMVHLHTSRVDGIFGSMSFIKYILAQLMVLQDHQMILETKSAFIIHTETINLLLICATPSLL